MTQELKNQLNELYKEIYKGLDKEQKAEFISTVETTLNEIKAIEEHSKELTHEELVDKHNPEWYLNIKGYTEKILLKRVNQSLTEQDELQIKALRHLKLIARELDAEWKHGPRFMITYHELSDNFAVLGSAAHDYKACLHFQSSGKAKQVLNYKGAKESFKILFGVK